MKRSAGFTLVELLIALALAGIVTLLILSGTRFAALALDRSAAAAERLETHRSLDALLRRELGSAVVLPMLPNVPQFIGAPDKVQFFALAEDGGAGAFRTTIAIESRGGTRALVLMRKPLDDDAASRTTVLVPRLGPFALAYFGAEDGKSPQWHDRWERQNGLPALVRLTRDGDAIVVRLWTTP